MTAFTLTDSEWELVANVPVSDLVALAADVDVVVPQGANRRALVEACVPRMLARGRAETLPLVQVRQGRRRGTIHHSARAALAEIQGLSAGASVSKILSVGQRAWRALQKKGQKESPFGYMVPLLLEPLTRHAVAEGLGR